MKWFDQEGNQIIIHTDENICSSQKDLLNSEVFLRIVGLYIKKLRSYDSPIFDSLPFDVTSENGKNLLLKTLRNLNEKSLEQIANDLPNIQGLSEDSARKILNQFVEGLYNFWRTLDRFLVCHATPGLSSSDKRTYRSFNAAAEELTHLVRGVYRDICENINQDYPLVYRQVAAGCQVALRAIPKETGLPATYLEVIGDVPFIRQVWITPPLIIDTPMNKRTGEFFKVDRNPIAGISLDKEKWLCYPAQVGSLIIYIYFHQRFIGLGSTLSNLFELATDKQLQTCPDAVYLFGVPSETMSTFGDLPTVFFDDEKNKLLTAAVPCEDRFGYFGYLKKMPLTLHNIAMMKRGRMPFHGAMVRILLKNNLSANILLIGDTATGKSETLEAFRIQGKDNIRDMRVIADDMGSIEVNAAGKIVAYGTEIGAFIRMDDLQDGFAFGQIDRAIIMSPQKVNARVVLPVTTIEEVLQGYPLDFILYANNYEEVDSDHPILSRIKNAEQALDVFRDGSALAKGTTTSVGLTHSYFANIFGPSQYKETHEALARQTFEAAFKADVWVGQLRTRLGIPGYEMKGPQAAAKAILQSITESNG